VGNGKKPMRGRGGGRHPPPPPTPPPLGKSKSEDDEFDRISEYRPRPTSKKKMPAGEDSNNSRVSGTNTQGESTIKEGCIAPTTKEKNLMAENDRIVIQKAFPTCNYLSPKPVHAR